MSADAARTREVRVQLAVGGEDARVGADGAKWFELASDERLAEGTDLPRHHPAWSMARPVPRVLGVGNSDT
jgi:hypothetical protein